MKHFRHKSSVIREQSCDDASSASVTTSKRNRKLRPSAASVVFSGDIRAAWQMRFEQAKADAAALRRRQVATARRQPVRQLQRRDLKRSAHRPACDVRPPPVMPLTALKSPLPNSQITIKSSAAAATRLDVSQKDPRLGVTPKSQARDSKLHIPTADIDSGGSPPRKAYHKLLRDMQTMVDKNWCRYLHNISRESRQCPPNAQTRTKELPLDSELTVKSPNVVKRTHCGERVKKRTHARPQSAPRLFRSKSAFLASAFMEDSKSHRAQTFKTSDTQRRRKPQKQVFVPKERVGTELSRSESTETLHKKYVHRITEGRSAYTESEGAPPRFMAACGRHRISEKVGSTFRVSSSAAGGSMRLNVGSLRQKHKLGGAKSSSAPVSRRSSERHSSCHQNSAHPKTSRTSRDFNSDGKPASNFSPLSHAPSASKLSSFRKVQTLRRPNTPQTSVSSATLAPCAAATGNNYSRSTKRSSEAPTDRPSSVQVRTGTGPGVKSTPSDVSVSDGKKGDVDSVLGLDPLAKRGEPTVKFSSEDRNCTGHQEVCSTRSSHDVSTPDGLTGKCARDAPSSQSSQCEVRVPTASETSPRIQQQAKQDDETRRESTISASGLTDSAVTPLSQSTQCESRRESSPVASTASQDSDTSTKTDSAADTVSTQAPTSTPAPLVTHNRPPTHKTRATTSPNRTPKFSKTRQAFSPPKFSPLFGTRSSARAGAPTRPSARKGSLPGEETKTHKSATRKQRDPPHRRENTPPQNVTSNAKNVPPKPKTASPKKSKGHVKVDMFTKRDDLLSKSSAELKALCRRFSVKVSDAIEKVDLVDRLDDTLVELRTADAEQKRTEANRRVERRTSVQLARWAQGKSVRMLLNDINGKTSVKHVGYLKSTSSFDEVHKSYRRAMLKIHPDKNLRERVGHADHFRSAEMFKIVNEAFQSFRALYDS